LKFAPGNDIAGIVDDNVAFKSIFATAIGLGFLYLNLEFNRTFGWIHPPMKLSMMTLLWVGMCGILLVHLRRTGSIVAQTLLVLFTVGTLLKVFTFDVFSWQLRDNWLYGGEFYVVGDAFFRLLDFGAIIAFFGLAFVWLKGERSQLNLRPLFGWGSVALLFIFLTLELNTVLFHFVPGLRSGGISILWTLFALSMIFGGIRRNVRPLRLVGLGLFAIVAGKIFLVDLARLDQLYRIVAFILLGVLVLCGSFLYLKYRTTFAIESPSASDSSDSNSGPKVADDAPAAPADER
jgi:uncharacterized membrane protein